MSSVISFKHSGDIGDIVASLATVKEICERDNCKADFLLDASGGIGDEFVALQARDGHLKFNEKAAEFVQPLIAAQPYIASATIVNPIHSPIKCDINLNQFRRSFITKEVIEKTNQNLLFVHQVAFGLEMGYKGKWLYINDVEKRSHKFVISRTPRYQSAHLLCDRIALDPNAEFIGTDFEWELWKQTFGKYPQGGRILVNDAFDAARHIGGAGQFFSNGTCFYWIAIGLGVKHIVHELGCDIWTTYFPNQNPEIAYFIGGRRIK